MPILTAQERQPEAAVPTYNGGLGDMAVVWDSAKHRWVCFFQEVGVDSLAMAVSTDPMAASLTWSKVDPVNNLYSSGLMGIGYAHPDLASISGSNPTLLYHIPAQTWLMVWHEWEGSIAWAISADLDRWTTPHLFDSLLASGSLVYSYPIMVGSISDTMTTQDTNNFYYGQFPYGLNGERMLISQTIQFGPAELPILGPFQPLLQAPVPAPAPLPAPAQAPLPSSLPSL